MLDLERQIALDAVQSAACIGRAVQSAVTLGRWDKEDRTPVTVADLAIQAVIGLRLSEAFPGIPFMAEEGAEMLRQPDGAELRDRVVEQARSILGPDVVADTIIAAIDRGQQEHGTSRRYWVLDPVDGTKGFLRREQYAIALALIEDGQVKLGVLACPNLPESMSAGDPGSPLPSGEGSGVRECGAESERHSHSTPPHPGPLPEGEGERPNTPGQIFVAVRGHGAECVPCFPSHNSESALPARVSSNVDPAHVRWCDRVESSAKNHDALADVTARAGITHPPHRLDSQAKYAVVARGEGDLYLRYSIKPYVEKVWDHAAGVLVIEEAGGRVTDILGQPLDFSCGRELSRNKGIIATNGLIHDRVVTAVREVLRLN
ncbi:MAG: 3'(2'),5'-bisphosphate nucleotidase [Planctomycetales bacterium]|nr:3'(2'),5'-bisphosphate nucleotidase [Planctomycetales bacterium]